MKAKSLLIAIGLTATAIPALMLYNMLSIDIEDLILCSSNEGGIRLPSQLCEAYMLSYRGSPTDIEQLTHGAGLMFILNAQNATKKYRYAKFFISKGLSVNGVNHYGGKNLTPLHSAALDNDPEMVAFLLDHGADKRANPAPLNQTPPRICQNASKQKPEGWSK